MWWDNNYKREDFRGWLGGVNASSREVVIREASKYQSVLDCACGICLDYDKYKKEKIDIEYTGLDACEGLVEEARGRGITAVKGEMTDIPFEDGSFEVVTARHILEHLPDFKEATKAIKEMVRVAKFKVLIVFFMPLDKEVIGTDPVLGSEVHLNRYDRNKIDKVVQKYGEAKWTQVGTENILEIIKTRDSDII